MTTSTSRVTRRLFSATQWFSALSLLTIGLLASVAAHADDAAIRKNIAARLPEFPKIDEISKTPIAGLFELRVGTEIFYSDGTGDFLVEGQMIDTKSKANVTEARVNKLTAIEFSALPLGDAMVWKQGTGARKLAVFVDPNCGYCKRFERDLQKVKDVTVYTFLMPILGGDSPDKARDIWCAKDNQKAWRDWMLDGALPAKTTGACDSGAIARNTALGRKHRITGTPGLVFEDGKRVPGAMSADQVEKQLAASQKQTS